MIELISIHIPRTGGTSFYNILQQVYGAELSISYRRKDYLAASQNGQLFSKSLDEKIKVIHGHLYYKELQQLREFNDSKVICWMRDPVQRLISDHRHFIKRNNLQDKPSPQPHRTNESLLTYAKNEGNRNRMSNFLEGIELDELFFIGFLESFSEDLIRLGGLLNWPEFDIPKLNAVPALQEDISDELIAEIKSLNQKDYDLYNYAKKCI